ncbi:MAG: phosphate transporter permease PstA [Actinomycetota bacterium]|jgi:phosphate transport system permease protein
MSSTEVFEEKRQLHGLRIRDLLTTLTSATSAIAATGFLFSIAPLSGLLTFVVIAYVLFLTFYALITAIEDDREAIKDRIASVIVRTAAIVIFSTLIFIVVFTIGRGLEALPNWNFFTKDMSLAGPLDPLTSGGILHAIVGSLTQITIALVITIPLGLITAVFLNEMPGKYSRFVRTMVEAMTALPSIVAGLFIYATAILVLGIQKSGFAAALAISVMMLPIMIRASDVVLRIVPGTLKEASLGLGAGAWKTVWKVTLPTARSGLTTAIILATARGIGETSPVLLTSGFTASLNLNATEGPMVSLPLAIFQFVKSPEPTMIARGFGTAAVLMLLVLILFLLARILGSENNIFGTWAKRLKKALRKKDKIEG